MKIYVKYKQKIKFLRILANNSFSLYVINKESSKWDFIFDNEINDYKIMKLFKLKIFEKKLKILSQVGDDFLNVY